MPSDQSDRDTTAAARRSAVVSAPPTRRSPEPEPAEITGRQPREKRSVTLDAPVARAVDRLVDEGAARSFSAAINEATARWVANQQLGRALDELYEEDPDARPSADAVRAAAARLGLP